MKMILNIVILFALIAIFNESFALTCNDDLSTNIRRFLSNKAMFQEEAKSITIMASGWSRSANILIILGIVISGFVACVSFLKQDNDSKYKYIVGIVGVILAMLNFVKDTVPDGNFKAYNQAKTTADDIRRDIDGYFNGMNPNPGLSIESEDKKSLVSVCEKIAEWRKLKASFSTTFPNGTDWLVSPANAQPIEIRASGTGKTLIEAKSSAEHEASGKLEEAISNRISSIFSKPIFSSIKTDLVATTRLSAQKATNSAIDDATSQATYSVVYRVDDSVFDGLKSATSFPLTIFSTTIINSKINSLKNEFTDYGFEVNSQPAPRGLTSETNTIFVGSAVPLEGIKEVLRVLRQNSIEVKAVIFPWPFINSKLPEEKKANLVQIGGASIFESMPELSSESVDRFLSSETRDEMAAYSRDFKTALENSLNSGIEETLALEFKANKTATRERQYLGFGDEIYIFTLGVKASQNDLDKIQQVSYTLLRGGKDDLGAPLVADESKINSGFEVTYRGWGCYTNVSVTVLLKSGNRKSYNFNMCEIIKGE